MSDDKTILLRLDPKLHKQLKTLAARRETTMTALIRSAISKLVKEG